MILIGILVVVGSLFAGFILGVIAHKIKERRYNKSLEQGARDLLEGKRTNTLKIDGQEVEAYKFIVKGEDGSNIIIDLGQGGEIENARSKEESQEFSKEVIRNSKPSNFNRRNSKKDFRKSRKKSRRGL